MGVEQGSFQRSDLQPFREPIGGRIVHGRRLDVYELGANKVVKNFRSAKNLPQKERRFIQTHRLVEHYLGQYIPQTDFVRGRNAKGEIRLQAVQDKIQGRRLRNVSWDEIARNQDLVRQLLDISEKALTMFEDTKLVPDIFGINIFGTELYDVAHSRNLIIDENDGVWLVDTELTGRRHTRDTLQGRRAIKKRVIIINNFYQKLRTVSS